MICKNCGAEIDDNAKYCNKCGADVIIKKSKDEHSDKKRPAKILHDFKDLMKSRRFRRGFIISVVAIITVLIAVLLFFVLNDKVVSKKYESEVLSASGMKSTDLYYGDYNSDGKKEAYAVVYNNKVGYEFKNAQVWFVSADGTQLIDRNFTGHSNNYIKTGGYMFLSLEKNLMDNLQENEYVSYIYGVKEGISYQPEVSKFYKNMHQDGEVIVALDIITGEKLYFKFNKASFEFELRTDDDSSDGKTDVSETTTNPTGTAVYDVTSDVSGVSGATDVSKTQTPGQSQGSTTATTATTKAPENSYIIAFNGNGATGGSMASVALTVNESRKLPSCTFTRKGYAFNNWNSKPNGMGVDFYNTQEVKNLSNINGVTITLYAQWQPIGYTIRLDGNGGSSSTIYAVYDKNVTLPTPQRTGYRFYIWKDGSTPYDGGQTVRNLTSQNGGTVTLTAIWTPNTYAIVFDPNGAQGSTPSVSAQYDSYAKLSDNGFTRKGYTFEGWNTNPNGTGTSYSAGQNVINLATGGTVKLYAQWKEIQTSTGGDY